MENTCTFWLPDITNWWCVQEEMYLKYADLSYVARDIFSIMPHSVAVEASFSLRWDIIGWRQWKTTGETVWGNVVVRQFAAAKLEYWQAIVQHWIPQKLKTTWNWRKRRSKEHCIEWPRSTTFWRFGWAEKTFLLDRRNLGLKTNKWRPWDIFQIPKRSSKYPGQTVNMMVLLHFNCTNDHLCHQICLQRSTLEDEHQYWISAKWKESMVIHPDMMRIAHHTALLTLWIGLIGMVIWIIDARPKTNVRQSMNLTSSQAMASTTRKAQSTALSVPHWMFQHWFGQHEGQWNMLNKG